MFEKYANKFEYNGVEENRTKNGPNLPKNHDLQETDVFCKKQNKSPRRSATPLHIPSSLAHSRRNAVRHVNCIHNARSITKRLGTRQQNVRNVLFLKHMFFHARVTRSPHDYVIQYTNRGLNNSSYPTRTEFNNCFIIYLYLQNFPLKKPAICIFLHLA